MLERQAELTIENLKTALRGLAPSTLLVDPWVLRRVIWFDRKLTGLGIRVPHQDAYVLESSRLLAFVDRPELELEPTAELGPYTLLLRKPSEDEISQHGTGIDVLHRCSRSLLHCRVHQFLEAKYPETSVRERHAAEIWERLGRAEFEEARAVLLHDGFLFPEPTPWEVLVEFTAQGLELRAFAPGTLKLKFPAVRDWESAWQLLSEDIPADDLFASSCLTAPAGHEVATAPSILEDGPSVPGSPSRVRYRRWLARSHRAANFGNYAKAACYRRRAARYADQADSTHSQDAGRAELQVLVRQLAESLDSPPAERVTWERGLQALLQRASESTWAPEARFLADLQRASADHHDGIFRTDLWAWLRSGGQVPWRRPLPVLSEVLLVKNFRTARRRLAKCRLNDANRALLSHLVDVAIDRLEHRMRATVQPLLQQELDRVGLAPKNLPETIARDKLIQELLDHLSEHGYLSSGTLRDALSKGDLKLPDLSGLSEWLRGDPLLRADRQLAAVLDGVYRRAANYLRWSQRISAMAFGTRIGRVVTLHLALPFGGAFLALEGLRHLQELLHKHTTGTDPIAQTGLVQVANPISLDPGLPTDVPGGSPVLAVVLLGLVIHLLMHVPRFRAWCRGCLQSLASACYRVVVDLPRLLMRIPFVEQVLHSPAYAAVRNYLLRPALWTLVLVGILSPFLHSWTTRWIVDMFLIVALFLNSPMGRYADEWLTDAALRLWDELRIHVLGALFDWIMDVFHRLLVGLDRVLHTLDEWLRFRARDSHIVKAVKLVLGSVWSILSYFIVLVSTLLIEPQINPIKHFPVVTVAHKLILPMGSILVQRLAPYFGRPWAYTLVFSTIWLIPGVFGFLVWELRENWRLYAANRARLLRPQPLGSHGESMLQLLRPTFHSGTLPKAFARVRRALKRSGDDVRAAPLGRPLAALASVERHVQRFAERELLGLLSRVGFKDAQELLVASVALATNRVEVVLAEREQPSATMRISWEELEAGLVATVHDDGIRAWCDESLDRNLAAALSGLFQHTGVEVAPQSTKISTTTRWEWTAWVDRWQEYFRPTNKSPGERDTTVNCPIG